MRIRDIFSRSIFRHINGVVKASQQDDAVIWQELDEYVVTKELDDHFRKLFRVYLSDEPHSGDSIGVWISGFFGSGKSHFLKILSYILENRAVSNPETGETKRTIDFFKTKIKDPMLFADIKRAAQIPTDVILFNIDSRADASEGRAAILSVFWRVFNEMQGLSGESLPLAELERYLVRKGRYEEFVRAFKDIHGSDWQDERDAYSLLTDEIVKALSMALGRDEQSAREWFEGIEERFSLTVEGFARRVKEYLDSKEPGHRIVFLVDEVGQFIGDDSHLMLNLQTITEELGRLCQGRAWIMVTSQEDIDATLGSLKSRTANDFSKIQGRFRTRLSLSSANTDEVIQRRLLEKKKEAERTLESLFMEKGDIINNQISFSRDSATHRKFCDEKDFAVNYPFVPYHFQLVQKIFESIRKAGASGMHLSRGERSMLDAFQSAAQNISDRQIGALAPLYQFYPCIESFLDTSVKRSITQAAENPGIMPPFDIHLLQTLFLIRYVETIKPNIDNLVTLFIDQVDADRLAIKTEIQQSLERLERENLVNRSGDHFFFLTDEEREVAREIKAVEITSAEETRRLSEFIFDELFKGKNKHRYTAYRRDYPFHRICDGHFYGTRGQGDLAVEIITPLSDSYSEFNESKCIMYSSQKEGHLVIKLPDDRKFIDGLRTYLKTEKFILTKQDSAASPALKRILSDRAEENRNRKERLLKSLDALFQKAEYFALGTRLDLHPASALEALNAGLDYLIQNIYSKFSYLKKLHENPQKEIRAILLSDDLGQKGLKYELEEEEHEDVKEIATFIDLMTMKNRPIVLSELIQHFGSVPYGWPEWETALLVARMFAGGKIHLVKDGAKMRPRDAAGPMTKSGQWKGIKIIKQRIAKKAELQRAQDLGKELFGSIGPETQEKLCEFLKGKIRKWEDELEHFHPLAATGEYPGKKEIENGLVIIESLVAISDPYEFIVSFNEKKEELRDLADDLQDLSDFYKNQLSTWQNLKKALDTLKPNEAAILENESAAKALNRLKEIQNSEAPYGMLREVDGLIEKVIAVNNNILEKKRRDALNQMERYIDQVKAVLDEKKASADLRNKALTGLQQTKQKIEQETSIPNISYQLEKARDLTDEAIELIEKTCRPKEKEKSAAKPVKVVWPAKLSLGYLESEKDVERFLAKLREELMAALKADTRIKIQ